MVIFKKMSVVLMGIVTIVCAQDDAYHAGLKTMLQTQYSITGGTWIFASNEVTNINNLSAGGGTGSTVDITGQSFTKAKQLIITTVPANPWNAGFSINTTSAIASGDCLLMIFWARTISAPASIGKGNFEFMLTASPYTKFRTFEQRVGTTWKQYIIPFQISSAIAAGQGKFTAELGCAIQTIQIAGLNVINYQQTYALTALPRQTNDEYEGMEPNASWRAAANTRIEQYRKANLTVTVLNASNQPLANAQVKLEMLRHNFAWGTAIQEYKIVSTDSHYDATYTNKLLNLDGHGHGFNTVVLENGHKWVQWENNWQLSHANNATMVNWLKDRLVDVRGHTLIWPGWSNSPADLQTHGADLTYLKDRMFAHIDEMLNYPGLKGVIKEWDVVNEICGNVDIANAFKGSPGYPTGREIYWDIFNRVKAQDPTVRRFYNEAPFCSIYAKDSVYKSYVQELVNAGGLLDGLGFQSHFRYMIPPQEMLDLITEYHTITGGKIRFTEYDNETLAPDSLHRDYFRDLLTVAFSHPDCDGFLMWGFWSGTSWKAPLFNTDWSLKTIGQPFIDLVFNTWWTPTSTQTVNGSGSVSVRGFKGKYKVTITSGGQDFLDTISLDSNMTLVYKQPFGQATGISNNKRNVVSSGFSFNSLTNRLTMPDNNIYQITLFDMTGKKIAHLNKVTNNVDLSAYSAGVYVLRTATNTKLYEMMIIKQ